MKYLISPGFAKSGTTLLHACLGRTSTFAVPRRKELKHFLGPRADLGGWVAEFGDVPEQTEVLFEASPQYLTASSPEVMAGVVARIVERVPDARFVLNLRHPTERAYSHYVHNVASHFARFGAGRFRPGDGREAVERPYTRTFEEALETEPHLTADLHARLVALTETVGPERVKLFFLERDGRDFGTFYRDLCGWLGVRDDGAFRPGDAPRVHESAGAPVILYGGEHGEPVDGIEVPRRTLVIVNGRRPTTVVRDVSDAEARRVVAASGAWSFSMPADRMRGIYERHHKARTEALLDYVSRRFPAETGVPDYGSWAFTDKVIDPVEPSAPVVRADLRRSAGT
ncbi:hypothetical protein GCM10009809_28360 [Isoptericola hypogeus]|uniref:Sulfotransferase family protein n=1 Tax=Isoptericola hypogeus TaxID=300179 RepID=A0ABP4VM81_9MICO